MHTDNLYEKCSQKKPDLIQLVPPKFGICQITQGNLMLRNMYRLSQILKLYMMNR